MTDWIPVEDRLPTEDGEYLVTRSNYAETTHIVDVAIWYKSEKKNHGFHKANKVTAWMPLPEPYKRT